MIKKCLVAILISFFLFGGGFILKQVNSSETSSNSLTLNITNGAIEILPSQNGKLHYTYDKNLFYITKRTASNNNVTMIIEASKKDNWKPNEVMEMYVPKNLYSLLVINGTGVLDIKKLNIDYSISNSGGVQLSLPSNFNCNINYMGNKDSMLNMTLVKGITNYTCKVITNKPDFVSLPYSDFDSFCVPKTYKHKVGKGVSNWTFNIKEKATFSMDYK